MSTNLIIALTIALAVIANTRIVVGRSASMLPSEMLKDLEPEPISNRVSYDELQQRYMDGWPYDNRELEQGPPIAELLRKFEKSPVLTEQLTNSLDNRVKTNEEYPEQLPIPQPLKIQPYKKNTSQYQMTICHFKICNMGKRDTSRQRF